MPDKTLWTLNIGDFAPEVTQITYPLMRHYARKIGADFRIITERKFPDWPIPYEKLQIHELGRGSEWNIFVDADAAIHPECLDYTQYMGKDTVAHNGQDFAGTRWTYDKYFQRDGRNIGSCNWLAIASEWCLDLWRPIDDMTAEETAKRITITANEARSGVIDRSHLIDDYALSRNIARFGLKHTTVRDISQRLFGSPNSASFWHAYTIPVFDKTQQLRRLVKRLDDPIQGRPGGPHNGWAIRDVLKNLIDEETGLIPSWLFEDDDGGPIDGATREFTWKQMTAGPPANCDRFDGVRLIREARDGAMSGEVNGMN